jgi:hypothetical protein
MLHTSVSLPHQDRGADTIPSCPEMLAPVAFTNRFILLEEFVGQFPLEVAHERGYGTFGGNRDNHVDMVLLDVEFQDFDQIFLITEQVDALPGIFGKITIENLETVLGQNTLWYLYSYTVCVNLDNRLLTICISLNRSASFGEVQVYFSITHPVKHVFQTTTGGSGLSTAINKYCKLKHVEILSFESASFVLRGMYPIRRSSTSSSCPHLPGVLATYIPDYGNLEGKWCYIIRDQEIIHI